MDQLVTITFAVALRMALFWLAMAMTRVSTTLPALFVMAAVMTGVVYVVPNPFAAFAVGTVLFWIMTWKFTSADGVIDILLLVLVVNLLSVILAVAVIANLPTASVDTTAPETPALVE